MSNPTFVYMEKGIKVHREITGVIYNCGKRIYTMIDPIDL